jgi:hypothetical protein
MYYVETLTQNKSLFNLIVLKNNFNTLNMTYLNSMIQLYIYYEYYLYKLIRLVNIKYYIQYFISIRTQSIIL